MDFSSSEITSKKVHGSEMYISISEITSKKYVEIRWKFVEIWSSTYCRNIHVESKSNRLGVPIGRIIYSYKRNVNLMFICIELSKI